MKVMFTETLPSCINEDVIKLVLNIRSRSKAYMVYINNQHAGFVSFDSARNTLRSYFFREEQEVQASIIESFLFQFVPEKEQEIIIHFFDISLEEYYCWNNFFEKKDFRLSMSSVGDNKSIISAIYRKNVPKLKKPSRWHSFFSSSIC